MKTQISIILISIILWCASSGCKKAGAGGKAELSVYVKHHETLIPAAHVYLKFNEKEFPGVDAENYDQAAQAGSTGHTLGHTHFKNLKQGYYYLYSVGYDSAISQNVSGGIGIKIDYKSRKNVISITVPVTE